MDTRPSKKTTTIPARDAGRGCRFYRIYGIAMNDREFAQLVLLMGFHASGFQSAVTTAEMDSLSLAGLLMALP